MSGQFAVASTLTPETPLAPVLQRKDDSVAHSVDQQIHDSTSENHTAPSIVHADAEIRGWV